MQPGSYQPNGCFRGQSGRSHKKIRLPIPECLLSPEADGRASASVGEAVFAQSLKLANRIDASIIRLVTDEVILDRRRHRIAGYDSYVMGNTARKLEP